MSRKKSIDITNLPEVPQIPSENSAVSKKSNAIIRIEGNNDQLVTMLTSLKEREESLYENVKNLDNENVEINQAAEMSTNITNKNNNNICEEECRDYIAPLMNRTQATISTLLATKESLDQLDDLHRIIHQLLTIQEQNYQMRKRLKTVKTLNALKEMEIQINSDPEKFMKSNVFLEDGSDMDNEGMIEFEQNIADLETMLAASKSASSKRSASKKLRSKSVISETDEIMMPLKENNRNYPLRRQSAITDFKPKVSKWTKVKAAFKWEKANTLTLNESKSSDSILSPANDSYKNFLKVPSTPAPLSCNSGDSCISTSSGKVLTATSGSQRDVISSAPSSGDENDESTKARNYIRPPSFHDDERRSHSLDGELTFGANSHHSDKTNSNNKNSKSAWSKVKGIVTNRNSRKSIKSTGSGNSRDVSPIEFNDPFGDRSDSISSPNHSSSSPNNLNLGIPDIDLCPTSDENDSRLNDVKSNVRSLRQNKKGSKKTKTFPEIESLPEDEAFETSYSKRHLPSPLTIKKDFSETDSIEGSIIITPTIKKLYHKNLSISDPNSPMKNQEFFSEVDFSSGNDNDFSNSEPLSPLKRGSNNSSRSSRQQYEIMRNYQELQKKINCEFESKQQEWGKIRPLVLQLNNSVPGYLKEDLSLPSTPKNIIDNLLMNEENLSADFKRKLDEWRTKKGHQSMKESSKKSMAPKSPHSKYEQGLVTLPEFKDLPEEFQKKFNEWKQMKAEGRSPPPYSHQTSVHEKFKRQFSKTDKSSSSHESSMKKTKTSDDKSDAEVFPLDIPLDMEEEIVVQTSEGLMKFKGISRSFTRKLYEWEKAKGIEPASDSSTFAFLHPKYKATINENENDFENGMKRALSVDSIKPVQSCSQMSHSQPSSLSLNDADNMKESVEKKTSSNLELYSEVNESFDSATEEPEAVIVEVEDEGCELISSSASPQMQIPIFKFDFASKDLRSSMREELKRAFDDLKMLTTQFYETSLDEANINSIENLDNMKHLIEAIKHLTEHLQRTKLKKKDDKLEIFKITRQLRDSIHRTSSYEFVLPTLNNLSSEINKNLIRLEETLRHLEEDSSSLSEYQYQATSSIQNSEDKAMATIKITPTFICNSVKVDDSINNNIAHLKVSSESEMPELSTEDMRSDDRSTKKVTRNSSSSSKRKIRLRRMGSRQNSKTESDSDDEYTLTSETQRKVKRKSSRAKKQPDSDKSFDSFQGEEEVVYVFKIKPGETNEITTKTIEITDNNHNDSVLISPTENCVELIEVSSNDINNTYKNPIVKTKRKIFTPYECIDHENNNNALFISREIESSSGSEKTDKEGNKTESKEVDEATSAIEMSSIEISQQNDNSEKLDCVRKDLSPSIRLMIEKYHQNIEHKPKTNSNSSSPIWLSPVLDRRVRKQSAEYQYKILKSSSFQEIVVNEVNKEDVIPTKSRDDAFEKTFKSEIFIDKHEKENKLTESESTESTENANNVQDVTSMNSFTNSIELCIEQQVPNVSTGAIPKAHRTPHIQVIRSSDYMSDSSATNDSTYKNEDFEKPRTPLSERAMRIKQAKEAFFNSTLTSMTDEQTKWSYRMSQISVGSTDSNSIENMSNSCGVLPTKDSCMDDSQNENKTSSLPRNILPSATSNQEFEKDSQKHSKFGLSSLATKLRKVKLKRNTKEVQKMNTVPVLCRQSLNLFNESSDSKSSNSNTKNPNDDNVKKSKSLGKF
ncbi:putative leucine-rich repeat-containing protein DDB_G0290503 isoform X2 [Chironomus tepperi]|uniref:putative leucine-rich repeat-containing protein DDB_G0290503 isoform X2 n=1 Tax=Chironomus tepperi TaxID=113505 RepID=UPI00391F34AA